MINILQFAKIIDDLNETEIYLLLANKAIPSILLDIDNGISLCSKCHRSIHGRELEYRHLCYSLLK